MRQSVNEKCEHIAGVQKMSVREVGSDIVFLSDAFLCVLCRRFTRCEKTGRKLEPLRVATQRTR